MDKKRKEAAVIIEPVARAFNSVRISPDFVTLVSFILALLAGYLFWRGQFTEPLFLVAGSIAVLLSGFLDAVDGTLARLQNKASARGDLLDHVLDRYSDLAILLGIGLGPLVDIHITLFATIGLLLTSYMGTQAQAVGLKRNYSGFGRADRLVLFGIFPVVQIYIDGAIGLSVLEWLLIFVGASGNITAVQRFLSGLRELSR